MHPISDIAARMRHLHLPRGNETIARHLAECYRISIRAITTLDVGVHRIDRDDGDPWLARMFHEERSIERTESDAARILPGGALHHVPAYEGLWFAAWNYWTRTVKGNPPHGTEWWMPLPKAIYAPLGGAARAALLG